MQEIDSKIEGLSHEYKILVDHDAINNAVIIRLKELGTRVRIPGFRPGHVPLPILIKNYGDAVKNDAIIDEVKRQASTFLKEKNLKAALKPTIEIVENNDKGVIVKIAVEVLPEIVITDLGHPKIKKYRVKIENEKVDELISKVLAKNKKWLAKGEEPLAEGDKAVVDLEIVSEDKKHKEKMRPLKGVSIILGDQGFVKEFWENLVGMKVGEEKDFSVSDKNGGEPDKYHVVIHETFSPTDYELDEEFAKLLGLEKTDDIRQWATDILEGEYTEEINDLIKKQLLDKMADLYNFEIPHGMIELEWKEMYRQIQIEAQSEKKKLKADAMEKLQNTCKDVAARRVTLGLIIAKIAADNNITIAPDDIRKAIFSIARMYPGHEREVIRHYISDREALAAISGPLLEAKVIEFILDKYADVEVVEVTKEEFEKVGKDLFGDYSEDEFFEKEEEAKIEGAKSEDKAEAEVADKQ